MAQFSSNLLISFKSCKCQQLFRTQKFQLFKLQKLQRLSNFRRNFNYLSLSCKKCFRNVEISLNSCKSCKCTYMYTNLEETRKLQDLKILVNSCNNSKSLPFLRNHEFCAKQFRNFANFHQFLQKLSTKMYENPNIADFQASKITT